MGLYRIIEHCYTDTFTIRPTLSLNVEIVVILADFLPISVHGSRVRFCQAWTLVRS
jgi:hypothetical protein